MFGQKTGFGGTDTFGSSSFGSSTSGQTPLTFGAKAPAPPACNTPAFGSSTPNVNMFGGAQPTATTSTGLFGASTPGSFGQPAASTGTSFAFGSAPSGTTVKFNPITGNDVILKNGVSTNINTKHQCITTMKEYKNKSIEELRTEDYDANRKGPQANSSFGAAPSTGLFSFTPASSSTGFNFGTTQIKPMFGSTAFGSAQSRTTVKFNPITRDDMMLKNGVSTNVNTKHQCITTMTEYENKSIEELRIEDYDANRKGPQANLSFGAAPSTGLFSATPASSSTGFNFGTTQIKPMFGSTGTNFFGQPQQQPQQAAQAPSLFGQPASTDFGATTTAASGFGGIRISFVFSKTLR